RGLTPPGEPAAWLPGRLGPARRASGSGSWLTAAPRTGGLSGGGTRRPRVAGARRGCFSHLGTPSIRERGLAHPAEPPPRSREAARPTDGAAGKGWGRKRRPACNGPDRGCNITPPERGADFPVVSAGLNRQPTGVGCEAEMSAGP